MEQIYPKPPLDEESAPFWEGAKEHKLMIQECNDCDNAIFYPRTICPHCFSDHVTWTEASGKGHIHSYTVVHKARPPFKQDTPFVVAIIDLEEGARMLSRIVGDREDVSIGKPVSVVYKKVDEDLTLPCFQVEE
ncbi:hypothetical protein SAMN05192534_10336 [Alteribacillus persepolensis]|uniref:Zn-ribbon domain-containing OB-fold protein n=1 Tax=Alteribacillus persepolensis TaxID=568899 RepID=A0A1G8AVH3_9BACI|nr:Zn-ribbon domain-containing OB-fold protein [Alteribacillus persepolensis]SDH24961.1 hypothetical protein SAMN05192534_10336 [Alteribacillus persepolensis]